MSHDDCVVGELEAAVVHHVARVNEAMLADGLDADKVGRFIADRIGLAARAGLALGAAGSAASAGVEEVEG